MELEIVKFFNRTGGKWIGLLAEVFSQIVVLTFLWGLLAVLFLVFDVRHGEQIIVAIFFATILHFAVNEGIMKYIFPKFFFKRTRPFLAHPGVIIPHGQNHNDSSFPSNHMSTTLAVLTVIYYFHPEIWPAALIFSLFMAYARIRNGMHYPSDVLVGAASGIIYGMIGIALVA